MNLSVVKNEKFGEVEVDIYRNESEEMYMTAEQLGEALGYVNPRIAITKIINRNNYLKDSKFSTVTILGSVEGGIEKQRETRVFNEDGIYDLAYRDWETIGRAHV